MLYALYKLTSINLLQYITVRAGIAFFLAFIFTVYLMPKFIKWAKARNANQPIYALAPQTHQQKGKNAYHGRHCLFVCSNPCRAFVCPS